MNHQKTLLCHHLYKLSFLLGDNNGGFFKRHRNLKIHFLPNFLR